MRPLLYKRKIRLFRWPKFLIYSDERIGDRGIAFKRIMKTIVVSGAKSGVGKTYMAEQLLKSLSNWSALKVTIGREGNCPHQRNCGICPEIKEPFYIIKDKDIINQSGKDTCRLKEAGAKEVIWLKAKPEGLEEGLNKAMAEFSECRGVLIEGTSVLKYIKPDLNIHLQRRV